MKEIFLGKYWPKWVQIEPGVQVEPPQIYAVKKDDGTYREVMRFSNEKSHS